MDALDVDDVDMCGDDVSANVSSEKDMCFWFSPLATIGHISRRGVSHL